MEGSACGVMTIVACLPPGVGANSRTKRFGNYTIGSRSQSEAGFPSPGCIVCGGAGPGELVGDDADRPRK